MPEIQYCTIEAHFWKSRLASQKGNLLSSTAFLLESICASLCFLRQFCVLRAARCNCTLPLTVTSLSKCAQTESKHYSENWRILLLVLLVASNQKDLASQTHLDCIKGKLPRGT
jgi:hypothetical protein